MEAKVALTVGPITIELGETVLPAVLAETPSVDQQMDHFDLMVAKLDTLTAEARERLVKKRPEYEAAVRSLD